MPSLFVVLVCRSEIIWSFVETEEDAAEGANAGGDGFRSCIMYRVVNAFLEPSSQLLKLGVSSWCEDFF